jgi:hypothetical protein
MTPTSHGTSLTPGSNPITSAIGLLPPGADGGSVYLTPEALLVYCQSRLQDIDTQVQADMNQQQTTEWEQQQIGQIMTQVTNLQNQITKDSNGNGSITDANQIQKLEQSLEDLITQIKARDPNSPILGQLENLHDTIMASGTGPYQDAQGVAHGYYSSSNSDPTQPPNGTSAPAGVTVDHGTNPSTSVNPDGDGDNKLDCQELDGYTSTLKGMSDTLNNSAELGMIDIQSQMSQRQTAVQLVTNILQAYDDGLSKIAGNIGH